MNIIKMAKNIVRDAERYPWEYEQGEAKENCLRMAETLLMAIERLKNWRTPLVRPAKAPDANAKLVCLCCGCEVDHEGKYEHTISCPCGSAQKFVARLEGELD